MSNAKPIEATTQISHSTVVRPFSSPVVSMRSSNSLAPGVAGSVSRQGRPSAEDEGGNAAPARAHVDDRRARATRHRAGLGAAHVEGVGVDLERSEVESALIEDREGF